MSGHILLVEDSPTQAAQLKYSLQAHGYQVEVAVDGQEGLAAARARRPLLVIADIAMPVMDGYEMCRTIKQDETLKDVPVILFTALSGLEDVIQGLQVGADYYLTKPCDEDLLLSRVRSVLKAPVREEGEAKDLAVFFAGQLHIITSSRRQILNLLLSTYESAIQQRKELVETQRELQMLNEQLEQRIRQRTRQLRASEANYRTLLETNTDAMVVVDRAGIVCFANPAVETLFGCGAGGLLGEPFMFPTSVGEVAEVEISRPGGEPAVAEMHVMATEWEGDGARLVVLRDVTERRQLEERMRQQERLAAVGELAGGIAHDFNNLLTTIILYAQRPLGKHELPPDLKQALGTILSEARQAAELVRQILDFSRRSPIQAHPVDLKPFVREAIRVLQRTIPENISFALEVEEGKYVVNADPTMIQQVLMNLVVNARDAMPGGGVLRIGLERVQALPPSILLEGAEETLGEREVPDGWVCLSVSDTGTGIPPDVLPHIFEPFFTTKPRGEGTGLGLAQVYGIVKQHEGHIGVETAAGQGTTFRVYLPTCRIGEGKGGPKQEEAASVARAGEGETILLVEDNEKVRQVGRKMLESLGYRVLAVENGLEALDVYRSAERVDLVFTDLIMPEMGGGELIRELRKMNPGLKAVVATGYMLAGELEGLAENGVAGVVKKPFDAEALAQAVRSALDAR